ncbi:MAG: hypothetical protein N2C12_05355, partial [Planctomycetales bacterium]
MEFTREIYWNVGHGATTLVPMYLFTLAAVALIVNEAWQRIEAYRQGSPVNRTDNLPVRFLSMLKSVLL